MSGPDRAPQPMPAPGRRRPTIRDVARAAGVNPSTVSRVLNDHPAFQVSQDVRQRVLDASLSLGYEPSRFARALRTRRSYMLALGVPNVSDPFFSRMFGGAADEAERGGYTLVLTDEPGLESASRRASDLDGLLIATARLKDPALAAIAARGARFVLVNRRSDEGPYPTVRSDDAHGTRLAVEHLAALGHRRIAHLGGDPQYATAHDRRQGYLAAMASLALTVDAAWLTHAGFTPEDGAAAGAALLSLPPDRRPTAVVAVNDLTAVGLLALAHDRGIAVPESLSIVGFDDILMSRYAQPALTTVSVAAEEMGRVAVRQLLDGAGPTEVVLPVSLTVRSSTAPAPPVP